MDVSERSALIICSFRNLMTTSGFVRTSSVNFLETLFDELSGFNTKVGQSFKNFSIQSTSLT